tara:strand:+ start:518 stop:805 length:288 start_codon:yes stop_codon:yes gene_type:complete
MSYIKQHLHEQMSKQEELDAMKENFIDNIIDTWDEDVLRQFAFDSMFKYYEDYNEKQFKDMIVNDYGIKELAQLMERMKSDRIKVSYKDTPSSAS